MALWNLDALIAAHRRALVAFHAAIDAAQAAEVAFAAAHPQGLLVPNGLGAHYDGSIFSREEIKLKVGEAFDRARNHVAHVEHIMPGSIAPALAGLAAKEAEAIAAVDTIFDKEVGELETAENKWRETSKAEDEATRAICSYPCSTIEEARRKAAYVASIPSINDFCDGHALAFIRSFARAGEASS